MTLTTREAAVLLTLSPRTLQRYRMRGGGPRFLRIGGECGMHALICWSGC